MWTRFRRNRKNSATSRQRRPQRRLAFESLEARELFYGVHFDHAPIALAKDKDNGMPVDALELYRWAVQDPETHVAVLTRMYGHLRGGQPRVLREDFAGTSAESVAWVAAVEQGSAVAIDRDPSTLAWAKRRAERLLGTRADRVEFVEADVLGVEPPEVPAADVIAALNFGVLHFHHRAALADYFQHARRSLDAQGILVVNVFGGPGAMRRAIDRRRVIPGRTAANEQPPPPFEYQWEQRRYDAVSGRLDCRIHFVLDEVPGQTQAATIEDAFQYDWRLWTLPELVELMSEAGFSDVQVWRHAHDPSQGESGVFLGRVASIENMDTWLAYVIALR